MNNNGQFGAFLNMWLRERKLGQIKRTFESYIRTYGSFQDVADFNTFKAELIEWKNDQ